MEAGQFPGSLWVPARYFAQGRGRWKPKYIIAHGTAWPGPVTAEGIARFFQHPDRATSTHYVIDKDGSVYQCVREEDTAYGNGWPKGEPQGHAEWWGKLPHHPRDPNLETISIEHVKWTGATHNDEGLTESQWESSYHLIEYLCTKWGIPRQLADETGGITGHFSIDPQRRKYCPGPYPWQDLIAALNRPGSPSGIPALKQVNKPVSSGYVGPAGPPVAVVDATQTGKQASITNPLPSVGAQAHAALQELPGWAGIVEAINAAEQTQPFDGSHIGNFVVGNSMSLALRGLLIVLGVLLLLLLLVAAGQQNSWIGDAGADVLPLMRHASASKQQAQRFQS